MAGPPDQPCGVGDEGCAVCQSFPILAPRASRRHLGSRVRSRVRLLGRIIFCSCFWSVSFLQLARFEKSLSTDVVCVFMLGHAELTCEDTRSSRLRLTRKAPAGIPTGFTLQQ